MVDFTPSGLLLEPGAPQWAQRFALRLAKTFQNLFPTQPTRLWNADPVGLPLAADWPNALAMSGGLLEVSDGSSWKALADVGAVAAAQMQFGGVIGFSANSAISPAWVNYLLIATAACTLTLPLASAAPASATYWFQNGSAGNLIVNVSGADGIWKIGGYVATLTVPTGKFVGLARSGANWYSFGGSIP